MTVSVVLMGQTKNNRLSIRSSVTPIALSYIVMARLSKWSRTHCVTVIVGGVMTA